MLAPPCKLVDEGEDGQVKTHDLSTWVHDGPSMVEVLLFSRSQPLAGTGTWKPVAYLISKGKDPELLDAYLCAGKRPGRETWRCADEKKLAMQELLHFFSKEIVEARARLVQHEEAAVRDPSNSDACNRLMESRFVVRDEGSGG